jgi:hypothetical protein
MILGMIIAIYALAFCDDGEERTLLRALRRNEHG